MARLELSLLDRGVGLGVRIGLLGGVLAGWLGASLLLLLNERPRRPEPRAQP